MNRRSQRDFESMTPEQWHERCVRRARFRVQVFTLLAKILPFAYFQWLQWGAECDLEECSPEFKEFLVAALRFAQERPDQGRVLEA